MSKNKPILGEILGATIMTPNLKITSQLYVDILNYRIRHENYITKPLTRLWDTKAHINAESKILAPQSKETPWIRFIEAPKVSNYKAMTTFGWHSLEINVQKVDSIPEKLKNSKFKIIGKPHALGMSDKIRAMQIEGPSNEILYLTEILDDPSLKHLPKAETFIDKIFIVPLGSPNMNKTRDWYLENFPNIQKGIEALDINMPLISEALDIDLETKLSICTIRLPKKFSIEIDQYPNNAFERKKHPNSLPPGISIVSFKIDSLDKLKLPFISKPQVINEYPYNKSRVGLIMGTANEIIELIERK